jgi:hypothetical protein
MNNRDKLEANERKQELIQALNNTCQVCFNQFPASELQLAHRIPKHDRYLKKWGTKVINHRFNLVLTCGSKNGRCNSSVMVNPRYPKGKALLKEIENDILSKS